MRERIEGLDLREALRLVPPRAYWPDFLTPPPTSPVPHIEDELGSMRTTPAEQVAWELGHVQPPQTIDSLDGLVDTLSSYFDRAIRPSWPKILALLQADVHYRARRLIDGGPERLFADLHPTVSWTGSTLTIKHRLDEHLALQGRGLVLVPSAFTWERPAIITRPPWQPTLIYPARGIGLLWDDGSTAGHDALEAALGLTRARLLLACATPASTAELAERLDVSPAAISQHLGVLRAVGLVSSQRDRRRILSARTALGDALVGT